MLQCTILSRNVVMNFPQALQALLSKRFRGARPDPTPAEAADAALDDTALAGTSFVEQEPALSQELHLTTQDISGWAAGGSSLSD
jgi:hypothetical protein